MAKAATKTTKSTTRKDRTDIFIYRLESGGYATHPSPFVIYQDVEKIQFRNLTDSGVKILFKTPVVDPPSFSVRAGKKKVVNCASCQPGIYEYKVAFVTPAAPPGIRQLPKTYAQGHSSPKIIVDT